MKKNLKQFVLFFYLFEVGVLVCAQDSAAVKVPSILEPVKKTFIDNLIIDNQTVMVPVKGIFEFVIQHRFGIIKNGYKDFFGLYASSNIRLGFNYTPIANLQLGFGFTKERMQWDGNVKYAIIKQSKKGGWPVSATYYGVMSVDTRPKEGNFVTNTDRISYFNQLIIARKVTKNFSAQVAPGLSWFNNVEGYISSDGSIKPKMKNAHLAIAIMGSYAVTDKLDIIANYDQPLTWHPTNNPHPNISVGVQIGTSTHTFQIFLGNYQSIVPQTNNFFNQFDYTKGDFLIGFNITKR